MCSTDSEIFIEEHRVKFIKLIEGMSEATKHIIYRNSELNEIYDNVLDFIIDSSNIKK